MDLSSKSNKAPKPQSRKRNRVSTSCNHCRFRKLKCSRTEPCDSCLRTGDSDTCSYISRPVPQRDHISQETNTEVLTARISRLEQLLSAAVSLENGQKSILGASEHSLGSNANAISFTNVPFNTESTSASPIVENEAVIDDATVALGSMKIDPVENQTIYLGAAHWVSILSEVEELKRHLLQNDALEVEALNNRKTLKNYETPSSLLRGIALPASREYLFSFLPPKETVDILLDRFFDNYRGTLAYVHEPTFRQEYACHWMDPTKTRIIWLGQLYAMLHSADVSYDTLDGKSSTENGSLALIDFKSLTVQCLIASDYTNPVAHTLETLVLYTQFDSITSPDLSIETPLILGMVIRLAMRMGIHRDSKAHPGLTPFQDEMRRRLWATLLMADVLHSVQLSLPEMISQTSWDCALPRNLRSSEFGPSTTVLPPSRPLSEETEVTYMILKTQLLLVLKNIMILTSQATTISDYDIQRCEKSLAEAYLAIPSYLQIGNYDESRSYPLSTISHRISLDRVYRLCRCVLYRRFLRRGRTNPAIAPYRKLGIDAAVKSLHHHATLFKNYDPITWPTIKRRYIYSQPTMDFYIAGMILALDLYYSIGPESTTQLTAYETNPDVTEIFVALQTSNQYFKMLRHDSAEAAKAYGIFSFVLQKFLNHQPETEYATLVGDWNPSLYNPEALQCTGDPAWGNWNMDDANFETFLQWPSPAGQM